MNLNRPRAGKVYTSASTVDMNARRFAQSSSARQSRSVGVRGGERRSFAMTENADSDRRLRMKLSHILSTSS